MGQSADQIREEIDLKRSDAADKIDQLKDQVQGTADQMRGQVQDTVEQVKGQVQGTVDDTIQTVKDSVDFRQQIEERPLVALGVAFFGGVLLGGMTSGSKGHSGSSQSYGGSSSGGSSSPVRTAFQRSGLDDTIANATAALMGSVTDQLKNTLDKNFPGFADKMQTAERKPGDFAEKSKAAQSAGSARSL